MTIAPAPILSPEVVLRGTRRRQKKYEEASGPLRSALYGRLSRVEADGTEEKTIRQLDDGRGHCGRVGWDVVGEYVDSDFSGFCERLVRPGFEELLDAVERGDVDVIVVWRIDRLTRQPKQIERVIDLLESDRLLGVYSIMEPLALDRASRTHTIKTLRDIVNAANYESRVKADRQQRQNRARAENGERGTTGGYRAFGFEVDSVTHRRDEAALIVEAVDRVLDGGWSLASIVRDWNARGITTPTRTRVAVHKTAKRRKVDEGGPWRVTTLRNLLLNPKLAGLRAYKYDRTSGEYDLLVVGKWEPIIPRERWERLADLLRRRARAGERSARTYLLSGMGRCALCGSKLISHPTYRKGVKVPRYACPAPTSATHFGGCGKAGAFAKPVEDEVVGQFLDQMSDKTSDLRAALLAHPEDDGAADAAIVARLEEIATALDEADNDHRTRAASDPLYLPRDRYAKVVETLTAERETLREQRTRTRRRPLVEALAEDPFAVWERWNFDQRRAALAEALECFVLAPPAKPYERRFDPSRVVLHWKG